MSRVKEAFQDKKALIPFITGGYPSLEVTKKLLSVMQEAGADLIEIGIPFSDPAAEGVEIQEANERALAAGCTTDKLFDMVKESRKEVKVPVIYRTYFNPIYTYGKEKFMKRCVECGIDGVIVPDLPYEEKDEILPMCRQYGVDLISIVVPFSKERIFRTAEEAEGYIYCVSRPDLERKGEKIQTALAETAALVREAADIPCVADYDSLEPEQGRTLVKIFDGVAVHSAVMELISRYGEACVPHVSEYVRKIKEAVK